MKAIASAILICLLLVGCLSPGPGLARSDHDWSYSELVSAIDKFRKEDRADGPRIPKTIHSIEIAGDNMLKIYLTDYPPLSGGGCELSVKRNPAGDWIVEHVEWFTQ